MASFDIATWETTGAAIPVALDGVAPTIELDFTVDGLPFPALPVTDQATLWTGLAVDATTVRASLGAPMLAQVTTQDAQGTPASIALGTADFLSPLATNVIVDDRAHLAFRWGALGDGAAGADAIDFHVTWNPGMQIAWDAVLSTDADQVTFPALDADLAALIALPTPSVDGMYTLRIVDAAAISDFPSLDAAGLVVTGAASTSSIAPASGEIRTTYLSATL
jgi:hypothetical protein